jgi:hypothetical protein
MTTRRDRTLPALTELALALALIATWQLPWYQVTPTTPDRIPIGPAYTVGVGGMLGGGMTEADLMVRLGPILIIACTVLAAVLTWRGFLVAALVTFLTTGTVGAFGMIHMANFGELSYYPVRPDVGLQAFAWICLAGTLVAAFDLTRGGSTTALSRRLGQRGSPPATAVSAGSR